MSVQNNTARRPAKDLRRGTVSRLEQERAMWGVGGSWYRRPEPAEGNLIAPFDGFAATTRVQERHAVAFPRLS